MVIKLCIRQNKQRTDGSYSLYFSFANGGKTRYIASSVAIPSVKNFKNGQIVGTPNANYNNAKLNQQLIDYQKAYDNLPLHVKYAGLDAILSALRSTRVNTLSFRQYAQKIIDDYQTQGKGSWRVKEQALKKFVEFYGELPIESITKTAIIALMEYLQRNLSETSVGICLREIKSIYNMAVNDEKLALNDKQPFKGIKIPKGKKREIALTVENIQAIQALPVNYKTEQVAKDIFGIILCLGGINMKDLLALAPSQNGRVSYYRAKTDTTKDEDVKVSLAIQPELAQLIAKYKGTESRLFDFGYRYANYLDFVRYINKGLKKIAAKAGVNVTLTTSVIRHSWATIADELGVSENVIDYVLGHSVRGMAMKYIHRRYKAADEAIRFVLDAIDETSSSK
ncbi:MAG: site-specific integrase [Prevotellaceae bacterium]|jgi:integrase|nr:site-specific integrase [Prevotellaceae bacterium]